MRKNLAYYTFFFAMTLALLQGFNSFRYHFMGLDDYKAKIASLQQNIKQEKLRYELQAYQLNSFKQEVAQVLPQNLETYQERQIASIVRQPEKKITMNKTLFEKAKKDFREKDYESCIKNLKQYLRETSVSGNLIEAKFLLAESHFLLKHYPEALVVIDEMLTLYPENDLTGLILLRMGQIHQIKERKEDAIEVYRVVMNSFKNENIKKQAQILLAELGEK